MSVRACRSACWLGVGWPIFMYNKHNSNEYLVRVNLEMIDDILRCQTSFYRLYPPLCSSISHILSLGLRHGSHILGLSDLSENGLAEC